MKRFQNVCLLRISTPQISKCFGELGGKGEGREEGGGRGKGGKGRRLYLLYARYLPFVWGKFKRCSGWRFEWREVVTGVIAVVELRRLLGVRLGMRGRELWSWADIPRTDRAFGRLLTSGLGFVFSSTGSDICCRISARDVCFASVSLPWEGTKDDREMSSPRFESLQEEESGELAPECLPRRCWLPRVFNLRLVGPRFVLPLERALSFRLCSSFLLGSGWRASWLALGTTPRLPSARGTSCCLWCPVRSDLRLGRKKPVCRSSLKGKSPPCASWLGPRNELLLSPSTLSGMPVVLESVNLETPVDPEVVEALLPRWLPEMSEAHSSWCSPFSRTKWSPFQLHANRLGDVPCAGTPQCRRCCPRTPSPLPLWPGAWQRYCDRSDAAGGRRGRGRGCPEGPVRPRFRHSPTPHSLLFRSGWSCWHRRRCTGTASCWHRLQQVKFPPVSVQAFWSQTQLGHMMQTWNSSLNKFPLTRPVCSSWLRKIPINNKMQTKNKRTKMIF